MFAVTDRLLLRPGWAEDAPALAAALADEGVVRSLSRVPRPYALADAEAFLALPADPMRPCFLVFERADARLVGGIDLHGRDAAELGYWITRDRWGRGYATEAGRAVCALADASLRLPQLRASHALDNPASGAVLRKLGFRPGAQARLHSVGRGEGSDVRLLVRDRADAEASPLAA